MSVHDGLLDVAWFCVCKLCVSLARNESKLGDIGVCIRCPCEILCTIFVRFAYAILYIWTVMRFLDEISWFHDSWWCANVRTVRRWMLKGVLRWREEECKFCGWWKCKCVGRQKGLCGSCLIRRSFLAIVFVAPFSTCFEARMRFPFESSCSLLHNSLLRLSIRDLMLLSPNKISFWEFMLFTA